MSFTAGPWTIGEQNGMLPDEGLVGVLRPKQTSKAGVEYRTYVAQYVRPDDARLIAAAPELYEKLKALIKHATKTGRSSKTIQEAQALIRKIEG